MVKTDHCRIFSHILVEPRLSPFKSKGFGVADICRKPQQTADFPRIWFLTFGFSLLALSYFSSEFPRLEIPSVSQVNPPPETAFGGSPNMVSKGPSPHEVVLFDTFHPPMAQPSSTPAHLVNLVAPYCAMPRAYLSDTPLLRALGFLVSQHGQVGAIPPPPFLRFSPLERACEVGVRYPPPPQKGYLSDTCAIPYEKKAKWCDTPSAILSRKGIVRYGGGYLAPGR